jgi:hypothetical protein
MLWGYVTSFSFFFFSSTFLSSTPEITTRLWRNVVGAHLLPTACTRWKLEIKNYWERQEERETDVVLLQPQLCVGEHVDCVHVPPHMVRKPNLEGGKKGSKTNKEYLDAYAHTDTYMKNSVKKWERKKRWSSSSSSYGHLLLKGPIRPQDEEEEGKKFLRFFPGCRMLFKYIK